MDTNVITSVSGSSEVKIFSVFVSWTMEGGNAAITEGGYTNPLLRIWLVSPLSPLTKRAAQQTKKSQFPQLIRL